MNTEKQSFLNSSPNNLIQFIDLGLIDYQQAWDYQTNLFNQILEIKKQNRDLATNQQLPTSNYLIFCEHPHVYTLGKSGDENNLLIKKEDLHGINASYYPINRGGDITYHGPGQLVVYPILDLNRRGRDLHGYLRTLEESVIETLHDFRIAGERLDGKTGVWLNSPKAGAGPKKLPVKALL